MATDLSVWGILPGFYDVVGTWHPASEATVEAVLKALGADDGGPVDGPDSRPVRSASAVTTVRLDHPLPPVPEGELFFEDGGQLRVGGQLPPDLPAGYHTLQPDGEAPRRFVVSPGRCPEPPSPPRWGWAAQLYAARSSSSWGIGDLSDLESIARWSARLGAGMVLANPLHAPLPGAQQEPSPYYPSSRCFISPLYLRVEAIPGAESLPDLARLAEAGRALNSVRLIDRNAVWELKSAALERIFDGFSGDRDFDAFVAKGGPTLAGFATFCALVEVHGNNWRGWPEGLRHPASAEVASFVASREGGRRVVYHSWLQWHLDRQLQAASDELPLVSDMALGSSGGGADAWLWQDCLALGAAAGAPPDVFNVAGQDWGLPPWDPWKARAAGYEPFVQTLRACFRRAGGLRLDHVMGLFRLYWVPSGCSPAEGAYVRYPYWDLLNILALEADRAGAYVLGEDLGTVEDEVRAELAERRVLSYRLLWFEPEPPPEWPALALGAVTTHDLPTVAGVWTGADLEAQKALGLEPNEAAFLALRYRLGEWTGCADGTPVGEVIARAYSLVAESPCAVVAATLEDVAAAEERPNMPGTPDLGADGKGWPNWSRALPLPLEELERSELAARVAAELSGRGRGAPS